MTDTLTKSQEQLPEGAQRRTIAPAVDIYEDSGEILLLADLPGVEKGDVDIRLEGDRLTLRGHPKAFEQGNLLMGEYTSYDYERSFVVSQQIDAGAIRAELDQGVLRVHLPKAQKAQPRQIKVTRG